MQESNREGQLALLVRLSRNHGLEMTFPMNHLRLYFWIGPTYPSRPWTSSISPSLSSLPHGSHGGWVGGEWGWAEYVWFLLPCFTMVRSERAWRDISSFSQLFFSGEECRHPCSSLAGNKWCSPSLDVNGGKWNSGTHIISQGTPGPVEEGADKWNVVK